MKKVLVKLFARSISKINQWNVEWLFDLYSI